MKSQIQSSARALLAGALAALSLAGCATPSAAADDPATYTGQMRIPTLRPGHLTPGQQKAADALAKAFGGAPFVDQLPRGPMGASAHYPGFSEGLAEMFQTIRSDPAVDKRLLELMICVTGRNMNAQYEWYVHATQAEKLGVDKANIEAIRLGKKPNFVKEDEKVVYETFMELIGDRKLSQASWDRAEKVLGRDQLVRLVYGSAFYSLVSVMVVALDIKIPPPLDPMPLPPLRK